MNILFKSWRSTISKVFLTFYFFLSAFIQPVRWFCEFWEKLGRIPTGFRKCCKRWKFLSRFVIHMMTNWLHVCDHIKEKLYWLNWMIMNGYLVPKQIRIVFTAIGLAKGITGNFRTEGPIYKLWEIIYFKWEINYVWAIFAHFEKSWSPLIEWFDEKHSMKDWVISKFI